MNTESTMEAECSSYDNETGDLFSAAWAMRLDMVLRINK